MRVKKALLYKPVIVHWVDITTENGWQEEDEPINVPHLCTSYGYLSEIVVDEKLGKYITISGTMGVNGSTQYNQHITIPIGCIKYIEEL